MDFLQGEGKIEDVAVEHRLEAFLETVAAAVRSIGPHTDLEGGIRMFSRSHIRLYIGYNTHRLQVPLF